MAPEAADLGGVTAPTLGLAESALVPASPAKALALVQAWGKVQIGELASGLDSQRILTSATSKFG